MTTPGWLVASPIAHRGLHDKARGIIENSASAALAAIDRGFAIECDVQLTSDGEAVVFHDFALDRLTGQHGRVDAHTAAALGTIKLTGSADTILSLSNFLALLSGRTPLILEIKSRFDGDMRLTRRTAEVLKDYQGPVAVKSFDPRIVAELVSLTDRPRGIISAAAFDGKDMQHIAPAEKFAMSNLLHLASSRPDFLSWRVTDLPHASPFLCRHLGHMPVMTWTVRTPSDVAAAKAHADQIVFEGFDP